LVEAGSFRLKALAMISGAAISLCLAALAILPPAAKADSWTNYCGGQVVQGKQYDLTAQICVGAYRTMNATMGMGNQHSVCVWYDYYWVKMCTAGPGAWVYNPGDYQWHWARPFIGNNAQSPTVVQGVAWTKN
jgi:hypothetical protein